MTENEPDGLTWRNEADALAAETDRLEAVRQAALSDDAAREGWDRLAWLTARVLDTPCSIIVLVEHGRPVVASATGLLRQGPVSAEDLARHPVFGVVLARGARVVVEDASRQLAAREAVALRGIGMSAMLSAGLRTSDGLILGSLSVLDRRVRHWTVRDAAILGELGEKTSTEVALHQRIAELERELLNRPALDVQMVRVEGADAAGVGHDVLTGLPNRLLLYDRLRQVLALARRYGEVLAVLHLHIRGLGSVKTTFGEAAGNQVLQHVAAALATGIRESDTVARLGDDEFMIVLPRVGCEENARAVSHKILRAIEGPVQIGDRTVTVNAAIGVALYPDDGHDAAALVHLAEVAVRRAHTLGESVFAFEHSHTEASPAP